MSSLHALQQHHRVQPKDGRIHVLTSLRPRPALGDLRRPRVHHLHRPGGRRERDDVGRWRVALRIDGRFALLRQPSRPSIPSRQEWRRRRRATGLSGRRQGWKQRRRNSSRDRPSLCAPAAFARTRFSVYVALTNIPETRSPCKARFRALTWPVYTFPANKKENRWSPALCVSGNFQGKQRVFGAPF